MSMLRTAPRYLAVGATCALLNIAVLIVGDRLHWPLGFGIAASFALVCLVGYALHAAVTFGAPVSGAGLIRYVLAMAANLPVSAALLWLSTVPLGWSMTIAAPAVTIAMLIVNFLSSRWAVVRPAHATGTPL